MYPFIRDLFVRFLGFKAEDVYTDISDSSGNVPDLAIFAPTWDWTNRPASATARAQVGPPALAEVRRRIATLRAFRWSSYRAYVGLVQAPAWLRCESVLEWGKFTGKTSKADYRRHVESAIRQGLAESPWEQLRDQVILGPAAFSQLLNL